MRMTPEERFDERIKEVGLAGCWEWQGSTNSNGYGKFSVRGRNVYAHRLSYELHVGEIPDGETIDHLCRNRRCCNPLHLEAVSLKVNVNRSPRSRKSHCDRGHALSGSNLYVDPKGFWKCRECKRVPSKRPILAPEARAEILRRAASGERAPVLAKEFGRSPQHINRLIRSDSRIAQIPGESS